MAEATGQEPGPSTAVVEPLGTFPLDWNAQGDEWTHRLEQSLPRHHLGLAGLTAQSEGAETTFEIRLRSDSEELASVVTGRSTSGSMELVANLTDADEELASKLVRSVREAFEALGRSESFAWDAIIGHPPHRIESSDVRLSAPTVVDGLRLESAEELLVDVRQDPTRLGSRELRRSVPIIVGGSSSAYSLEAASHQAARQLRTLCGVLSVAWGTGFCVRMAVQPSRGGRLPIQQLSTAGMDLDLDQDFLRLRGRLVEVPDWALLAPKRIRDRPWLVHSLDSYLEGTELMMQHPSLALICFTSAIEAVAVRIYRLERCETCGNEYGIAAAFRATLRRVVSEDAASRLDHLYGRRSVTVHEGRLHGPEPSQGALGWPAFSGDTSWLFQAEVMHLADAARVVLTWALSTPDFPTRRGPLPLPDEFKTSP